MGLGQTMVTAGFFVVLVVMFMNAYRVLNNADEQLMTAEAYKTASDLGQSLMAEIRTKKYDENYNPPYYGSYSFSSQTLLGYFASPSNLGPDSYSEIHNVPHPDQSPYKSIQYYDDVDDYNNYTRLTDSTNGLGQFRDSVIVYYVQMTNPPTPYYSGSWWTKRIEVWVTNDQWLKNKWVKLYSIVGASVR